MGYFTQPPGQGWIELGNMLKLFLSPTPTPFIPKLLKTVLNLTNRICRPVTITFITFCAFQCRAHPSWRTDSLGIPWRAYIRENILSGTCRASHMNTAAQIYCQEQTMCLFEFSGHVDKPYGHHVSFNLHINLLMIHKWVGIFFKITLFCFWNTIAKFNPFNLFHIMLLFTATHLPAINSSLSHNTALLACVGACGNNKLMVFAATPCYKIY